MIPKFLCRLFSCPKINFVPSQSHDAFALVYLSTNTRVKSPISVWYIRWWLTFAPSINIIPHHNLAGNGSPDREDLLWTVLPSDYKGLLLSLIDHLASAAVGITGSSRSDGIIGVDSRGVKASLSMLLLLVGLLTSGG